MFSSKCWRSAKIAAEWQEIVSQLSQLCFFRLSRAFMLKGSITQRGKNNEERFILTAEAWVHTAPRRLSFCAILRGRWGGTEEGRCGLLEDGEEHLSRFNIEVMTKLSISEFINISFHLNGISHTGSRVTNTHQYPLIIGYIQIFQH